MGASAIHAFGRFTPEGVWVSPANRRFAVPTPGLLLDRDGILIRGVNYLRRRRDVEIMPGAVTLLRWAAERSLPVGVVSNQSGIARGLFGWDDFAEVQEEISERLAVEGVGVDLVIACPFHPEHTKNWSSMHAHWRKPGPGMLKHASELLNLDLGRSWLIGDQYSDIAAASAAGMAGGILVSAALTTPTDFKVHSVAELSDAIAILLPHFP